ncbi:hypothetical protein [Nocardia sp. XZ_19_369]|uniref:hypothetical protein n=1 Tax=Nocardia sp. XZ_19_369 TaxID=2769487 RepID=UPI00188F8E97|nr:hypothetical protein [Nocardia sp. XZ_19_369]
MTTQPAAIGYVRHDISGAQQTWDETQIRSLAKRLGYELIENVVFGADTADRLGQLGDIVRRHDAEALITPTLEHLDGTAEPLVEICDVITVRPENTYARWAFPQIQADG